MKKRKLDTGGKVQEMRIELGSRRAVVQWIGAASTSSTKRWERRECKPLRAHVLLVRDAHQRVKATKKMRRMVRQQVLRELKRKEIAQKKRKK